MKVKDTFAFWLIGIGLGFLFLMTILFFWEDKSVFTVASKINDTKFSSFGAIISGLVGTFWSLAGVILFYVALTEQRKDMAVNKTALEVQTKALQEQMKEFELQTKELIATRQVYTEQLATQSLQRFESTFFQMVTLHHNLVDSTTVRDARGNLITSGRECFLVIYNYISKNWDQIKNQPDKDIVEVYLSVYENYQQLLGHYFRNLYHIFKFISKSDIVNKKFYANLVRAQLSSYELLLLVYNCLSSNGCDKFKPFIEDFSVFKNLDWTLIDGGKDIIRRYEAKAFGYGDFSFLNKSDDWN